MQEPPPSTMPRADTDPTVGVPRTPGSRRLDRALLLGTGAVGMGVVRLVDPNVPGTYPVCPSLRIFGVFCPLCGGLRSTHALASGDLADAMAKNPMVPLALATLLLVLGVRAWRRRFPAAGPGPVSRWAADHRVLLAWAGLVVFVAFGVLRNVDAFAVLGPR